MTPAQPLNQGVCAVGGLARTRRDGTEVYIYAAEMADVEAIAQECMVDGRVLVVTVVSVPCLSLNTRPVPLKLCQNTSLKMTEEADWQHTNSMS